MREVMRAGVVAGVLGVLGGVGPAAAITINDSAGLATAAALGDPFDSVARVVLRNADGTRNICTGSLIASGTLLTADHCTSGYAASDVTVEFRRGDGALRFTRSVETIVTFGDPFDGTNLLDGTDISVLALSLPVTDFDPIPLHADVPLGAVARFVGFGRNGIGSTGHTALDTVRRGAENVIDAYGAAPIPYAPGTGGIGGPTRPQAFSGTTNILSADFDDVLDDGSGDASNSLFHVGSLGSMLPFEGSGAPGDSGGPLLIRVGVAWAIAGVLSGGAGVNSTPDSSYSDVSYWTGVQSAEAVAFLSAFEGVSYVTPTSIPLPASATFLAAAAFALLRLRGRTGRA